MRITLALAFMLLWIVWHTIAAEKPADDVRPLPQPVGNSVLPDADVPTIARARLDAGLIVDVGHSDEGIDADHYWANARLIRAVWAVPLGHMIDRAQERCGCEPTEDSLSSEARLEYHIATRIEVTDRRLSLDQAAMRECRRELATRLGTCSGSRLPRACELDRIFGAPPLPFERPLGAECRWSNGDEGFDGTFLCEPGSHCNRVCTRTTAELIERRDRCENLLDLPFPAP